MMLLDLSIYNDYVYQGEAVPQSGTEDPPGEALW